MNKLNKIFQQCQTSDIESALMALDDLGFLIERHVVIRKDYSQYEIIYHDKSLTKVALTKEQLMECKHFLFFMLLNFPDRAWRVAWCLFKCYDSNIIPGLCQGIELYMNIDDVTTYNLVLGITSVYMPKKSKKLIAELFNRVLTKNLPITNEYLRDNIAFWQR